MKGAGAVQPGDLGPTLRGHWNPAGGAKEGGL